MTQLQDYFERYFSGLLISGSRCLLALVDRNGAIVDSNQAMAQLTGRFKHVETLADLVVAGSRRLLTQMLTRADLSGQMQHGTLHFHQPESSEALSCQIWLIRADRKHLALYGEVQPLLSDAAASEHFRLNRELAQTSRELMKANHQLEQQTQKLAAEISAREMLESALRLQRERAEQASEAKSQFLANMSHDIRTPMTAVLGYADLLMEPEMDQADRLAYAQTIRRNGRYLLALINEVLDLAKIEAGEFVLNQGPVDLSELLLSIQQLFEDQAKAKNLELNIQFKGSVPAQIVSDSIRLRQILVNLVSNAIKFTDAGAVTVSCGMATSEGDARLQLAVSDTGPGIAEDHLNQIFDPFVQVGSHRSSGTGLGLAICQRLISHMGGRIQVKSSLGVGSCFELTLPIELDHTIPFIKRLHQQTYAQVGVTTKVVEQRQGRLLLAEDGIDNRKLLEFWLKRAGFQMTAVENGQQAVEAVLQSTDASTGFDLVIMDMQMPVMDGLTATRQLRAAGQTELPIIALTAHAMEDDRQRCFEAGCNVYLAKPVDELTLLKTVASCLTVQLPD